MIILDTDSLSILLKPDSELRLQLVHRLGQVPESEVATTIITYEEITRGRLGKLARARTSGELIEAYGKLHRNLNVFASMIVLEFGEASAAQYAELRTRYRRKGAMDLRIAAIALTYDAILVTRNLKDFRDVQDLHVEDWIQ